MTTPTNSRFAKDLTFGVEIECYLPVSAQITVGRYHNGLQIDWAPEGWNSQSDASISHVVIGNTAVGIAPDGFKAVEIVSPVLMGEEGLTQVFYMLEEIKALGGIVTEKCGLHVHVGANHLSMTQVLEVRQAFIAYEKAFYGLSGKLAPWRYSNHYSKSSKETSLTERFQGLNLKNYLDPSPLRARTDARTVEFRVWAGTLSIEEVITAVYMAVSLVSKVTNNPAGRYTYIEDREIAAKYFVKDFWTDKQHRIVPEESAGQLSAYLKKQARKAENL